MQQFIQNYVWLIPALPLLGFILNGIPTALGAKLSRSYVYTIASGVMFLAFLLAIGVFCTLYAMPEESRGFTKLLWPWMHVGSLKVDIAFLLDPLSSVMCLIITGIGFLIHIYSTGYMAHDKGYARFFSYLNLFCFMMLLLVMGDNLFLLFVGWEGVGLCSYLLIGFWFEHKPNGVAGMKAFIVNRVGDFGMMIGLMTLFWLLADVGKATLTFTELKLAVASLGGMTVMGASAATFICIFLFVGATGKSAQIPLYVWLPDAMAGPTPVSALIHAATMVTAGVYMIARLNFLFVMSPVALGVIATVGALTAFMGATIGFAQNDIKKVLAYSTVSQLGYMFLALGCGAFSAGVFHLMTHAFFKACLFLGSGSVILGMHHEQDMRLMGGLRKYMPVTFITFFLSTIAIGGVVPFSGFFSKDEILYLVYANAPHRSFYWIGLLTAGITAFYMMRLFVYAFLGKTRYEHPEKIHESPWTMTLPLIILATLATFAGALGLPGEHNWIGHWLGFLGQVTPHHIENSVLQEHELMAISTVWALFCSGLAFVLYKRNLEWAAGFKRRFAMIYSFVYHKFRIDEIYNALVIAPIKSISENVLYRFMDRTIIDGIMVNGLGNSVRFVGRCFAGLQTGVVGNYAFYLLIGLILVIWMTVR